MEGKNQRRIESGETFFSMEWSGADEKKLEERHLIRLK